MTRESPQPGSIDCSFAGGIDGGIEWLITDFVRQVTSVAHTIVVSADDPLLARSRGLPRDPAEQLAAVSCGLASLTQGAARCFEAGEGRQTMVEMDRGYLFLTAISNGSCLSALAARDTGVVAYEMTMLVERVGHQMTTDPASHTMVSAPRTTPEHVRKGMPVAPAHSGSSRSPGPQPTSSAKIIVAGGFGVGKTTFVGSVSEIVPLTTEAVMTDASADIDDVSTTPAKTTTTVAMDFGRVTLDSDLILYLFGTPGQHRFWFMWDDLVRGAIGAVVLVDTRRLADAFPSIDFFEDHHLPYTITINCFNQIQHHHLNDVREALTIDPSIPITTCDARNRESTKHNLITLVKHALRERTSA